MLVPCAIIVCNFKVLIVFVMKMNRWLFTLQKSVALVLSLLLQHGDQDVHWRQYENRGDSIGLKGHPSTIFTNITNAPENSPSADVPNFDTLRTMRQWNSGHVPVGVYERRNSFFGSTAENKSTTPMTSVAALKLHDSSNFYRQISIDTEASIIRNQQHLSGKYTVNPQISSSFNSGVNYLSPSSPMVIPSTTFDSRLSAARSPIMNTIQQQCSSYNIKLSSSYIDNSDRDSKYSSDIYHNESVPAEIILSDDNFKRYLYYLWQDDFV